MSLHRELNKYLEQVDKVEAMAQRQIVELQDILYCKVETFIDDLQLDLRGQYCLVTPNEYKEVLNEVLKQFL